VSATTERIATTLALLAMFLLSACAEEPLPERRLSRDDCLLEVRMDALDEILQRCDRVVAAFPNDPVPLNERFLIHTLRGDPQKACRDIAAASKRAASIPAEKLDPLLRNDLRLRTESCRD
jgi:hypothetical protein